MKQNNFICVDVDTTGISDDSMVWRIAVKPYGGNTEIFEWYEDVEPSTLNYFGIDAEFLSSLLERQEILKYIESYLKDILFSPSDSKPILVCYDTFNYNLFTQFLAQNFQDTFKYSFRPYPIILTSLITFVLANINVKSFKLDNILPMFGLDRPYPLCEYDVENVDNMLDIFLNDLVLTT